MQPVFRLVSALAILAALHGSAFAQAAGDQLRGRVTDQTAGVLPGVTVELRADSTAPPSVAVTTMAGEYAFDVTVNVACRNSVNAATEVPNGKN